MTVAGIDENDAWYACLSASGDVEHFEYLQLVPTGYTPIYSKEGTVDSFGNAYVARADETGQSLISFRMTGPTSGGNTYSGWFEFYLSEACEVTHFNPDQWYGTGIAEYYDMTISNTGMGVSLGAGQSNDGPDSYSFAIPTRERSRQPNTAGPQGYARPKVLTWLSKMTRTQSWPPAVARSLPRIQNPKPCSFSDSMNLESPRRT